MDYWKKISKNNTPSTSEILDEFIDGINPQSKVLEIGCGYGRIIDICVSKKCFVYGIDINSNEIDALKFKYRNYSTVIIEKNDITDENFIIEKYKFDCVFINGLLGAVNLKQRSVVLKNILKVIHESSILHLSEFLLFEKDLEMNRRYLNDQKETGEYGTFFVYNKEGERVYQTHNFSEQEIVDLVSYDYSVVKKKFLDFKSYSGKMKPGIILLLKKKNV